MLIDFGNFASKIVVYIRKKPELSEPTGFGREVSGRVPKQR